MRCTSSWGQLTSTIGRDIRCGFEGDGYPIPTGGCVPSTEPLPQTTREHSANTVSLDRFAPAKEPALSKRSLNENEERECRAGRSRGSSACAIDAVPGHDRQCSRKDAPPRP